MNTSASVTCIVTSLPPAIDGVGDYALNLARQLRQDFGIETHFVVGEPTWEGAREIEGFPISVLPVRSNAAALSSLLNERPSPATVLLHYVGYGYARRGCPLWLVEGLRQWRTTGVSRFLVTMFHEIYACGPPWSSSFWLSPLQRNLAFRLAQLSDGCLTSGQGYAKILQELSQGKQTEILTLPVFSTIGEPEQVPTLAERHRRLVVFGGRSQRLLVYQKSSSELSESCQRLGIEELWDIGPPTGLTLSTLKGVPVVEMGRQPAPQVREILLNSLAGFFNYNPDELAKSTIFAAYCAHGLLPVSPRSISLPIDGIIAGKHYWTTVDKTHNLNLPEGLQAIADNARAWYQTHNLSVQAKIFAAQLANNIATKPGKIR
jgi:hypothetical protein